MKHPVILSLVALLTVTTATAQWIGSAPLPGFSLYQVAFPDISAAYITGDLGLMYKSSDGGATWDQIYDFGPFSGLYDVDFINSNVGFVSANGGVFRTLDGAVTWTAISAAFGQQNGLPLAKVKITGQKIYSTFTRNDTAYFVRSDDYGSNWTTVFQNYEVDAQPYVYSMVDSLNGYFINPNELAQVLKTTNGGLSFSDTLMVTNGDIVLQQEYDFTDLQHGYNYGSSGSFSHPTRTWNTGTFYFPMDLDGFGVLPVLDMDYRTSKLFVSSLYGKIFFSTDHGAQWTEQTTPISGPVTSIAFANEDQGIAVSGHNVIHTSNGGTVSVSELTAPMGVNIYPNPASGQIHIESDPGVQILQLSVISSNGETVLTIHKPTNIIPTAQLKPGVYLVRLGTADGTLTRKVEIE